MADRLIAHAPAKINLVLEVTGIRPDGYHEIDTILQTLDLADIVTLTFGEGRGIAASGPFVNGTPTDESNLAWKAAALLAERRSESIADLHITLEKNIPAAGGLGGGASDAVAVLRLLQKRWRAPEAEIRQVANEIGSDEAFFLLGGRARARGRGERVTRLVPSFSQAVVLFVPAETLERKTARMFAALDAYPFDKGDVVETFLHRDLKVLTGADIYNSFERVAFRLFPGLAELVGTLEERLQEPLHLAGAGPTLFWIGSKARAEAVAEAAGGLGCTAIATTTAAI